MSNSKCNATRSSCFLTAPYVGGGGAIPPANLAWDFNYNGVTFNPMVTGTLTPTYTFPSGAIYQVALRVIGNHCGAEIDVLTVHASYVGPTANAGADRTINVGDTVAFSGSYTDPDGIVSPAGMAWDFDYDGETFTEDATGTLTPTRQFSTMGNFIVALRVRDNHEMMHIALLYVKVQPVPPYVNAGIDLDTAAGDAVQLHGSYRMAGTVAPAGIEWDFNYNGTTFNPDPSATGDLAPSRQFNNPGAFTVALRITDSGSVSRIDTALVQVVNARPNVTIAETLTTTQGQLANFSVTVSSPDPVLIQWDWHTEDGTFDPDPAAEGQLNPSHRYVAAGTFFAAVRVTNMVGGAVRLRNVKVTVNDVPPTATVTVSGPTPEGSPVTFRVSNVTDVNPAADFAYAANWTGGQNFEIIPEDRLTIEGPGVVSFRRTYDDNGNYPVTVRVLDMEGGFTDYPATATVTNAPPQITRMEPLGGERSIGAGVPIRMYVDEPSHADHLAGFTYFVSVNNGPFQELPSSDFTLAASAQPYNIRAYARDKDGGNGPVFERSITISSNSRSEFRNVGTGSVRLNWQGAAGPVTVGPNQYYTFDSIVSGLTVTLLTPRADYWLYANSSIDEVNYEAGVVAVWLHVSTTGWQMLPDVGPGNVGLVRVPPGNSVDGRTYTAVLPRGDLGNVVGPTGEGKLWTEGSAFFDNLTGSITGFDRIGDIRAGRWIGDGADDVIRSNCGIDYLEAHGVRASVVSDRFRFTYPRHEPAKGDEGYDIGHGGATGKLELGQVPHFHTSGAVGTVSMRQLVGNVIMEQASSINRLYVEDVEGANRRLAGDYGRIDQLVLGDEAGKEPPAIEYFPLGMMMIVNASKSPTDKFWEVVEKEITGAVERRQIRDAFQVHHTKMQALKEYYKAKKIIVDDIQYLRAVPAVSTHREIGTAQRLWLDGEVKRVIPNGTWQNNSAQFLKLVQNDKVFAKNLKEFEERIENDFKRFWFSATESKDVIRKKYKLIKEVIMTPGYVSREGSRLRRLVPTAAAALAIFSFIGDNAALASNIRNHNAEQEGLWKELEATMRICLRWQTEHGTVPPRKSLDKFRKAFTAYWKAMGVDDRTTGLIDANMFKYIHTEVPN